MGNNLHHASIRILHPDCHTPTFLAPTQQPPLTTVLEKEKVK
jgi:hypothetical protein